MLVTADDIKEFAVEYDPQPMHVDEEAAKHTMIGGLCASGWHTCSMMMRIVVDGYLGNSSSMGSPGVEEVRWMKPVRPGDRLRVRATFLETRESQKPARHRLRENQVRGAHGRGCLRHARDHQHHVRAAHVARTRCGILGEGGMRYFEDIEIGDRREYGSHTFGADEIKAFARKYDPQPFHVDEEAAKRSHFGGLIASGWHTGAVCMRLSVDARKREVAAMQAAGEPSRNPGLRPVSAISAGSSRSMPAIRSRFHPKWSASVKRRVRSSAWWCTARRVRTRMANSSIRRRALY